MAEEESTQIQRNQIRGRRLKPRSKVWERFTRETDDDGNETAKCKRCGKVYAYHGTKHLWEHNEGCGGQESADAGAEQPPQPLPSHAQDEAMQQRMKAACLQEEASKHLARMIALRGYDASVLEDDCFRNFVRSLNPEFEVPWRVAIENMCDGIFDEAMRDLLDRLGRAPGKVNVAVGRAKTMEEQVFYVACHFIDDGWNLHKLLLHAIVITDRHHVHDGPILGLHILSNYYGMIDDGVASVISEHGIDDRLFMVAYELKELRYDGPSRLSTTYVDNVLHSIARCFLPDESFTIHVYLDMCRLNLTRQGRLDILAELDLHYGWAYDEHWYACYCSLEVLCKIGSPSHLIDEKIAIAKQLCKLWKAIFPAIQTLSSSTGPTANLCLAELFNLREILQRELAQFSGDHGDVDNIFHDHKDVTCVLEEAIDTLDKAIQDSYLAWSLPLTLDPRYKLEFIKFSFERTYGLEVAKQYVSNVTTMITELYADYAKEYGTTDGAGRSDSASAMDITTSGDNSLEKAWNEHCRSQQGMTTQVTRSCYPEAETDLDHYLREPPLAPHPQAEDFDILSWWKKAQSSRSGYPIVALMARDALAMPTCSKLSSDQMAQLRSILRGYSE